MKKIIIIISILMLAIASIYSQEGYTSSDGAILKQYLSPQKLKELIDSKDDSIMIIDVRPLSAYKKGHIPTAKSFPSNKIMHWLNEIPKDKYLILYCETGIGAQAVIDKLEKQGYTKMMNWGGYFRWKYNIE